MLSEVFVGVKLDCKTIKNQVLKELQMGFDIHAIITEIVLPVPTDVDSCFMNLAVDTCLSGLLFPETNAVVHEPSKSTEYKYK